MSETEKHIKAAVLLSGGLDSILAVCLLKDQGIHVEAVAFESPFFGTDKARAAAAQLEIPLHELDFTADIIGLLKNPPHGFGSCMNPCVDCHAAMLKRAGDFMTEKGFHFLATGEVLNERPMSQNRDALGVVAKCSGYAEVILRPLSALLLPETKPEREGWVDRQRLLALEGRGRKPQMKLAQYYGIVSYPSPAGGCHLTEPHFTTRLRDLRANEGLDDLNNVRLLKVGRHFRLAPGVKLVVGRNQADNEAIESMVQPGQVLLAVEDIPGPSAILAGDASDDRVLFAAEACASYADANPGARIKVSVSSGGEKRVIAVGSGPRDKFRKLML